MKALEHIKVLDLTQFEAGPSCTEILAFLGAEVVKIESPRGGDQGRYLITDKPGVDSPYFLLLNANKKSVTLNLKSQKGKTLFKQLVPHFDVMVENYGPGAIEELGLGYEVIEHLTQVKGVGVWTAHMFLIFTLRRPNILPVGDFGVRMAMYKHYLEKKAAKNGHGSPHPLKTANSGTPVKKGPKRKIVLPKPEQMEKIAKRWEPYRSIACWYLWQSLDVKTIG